MNISAKLAKMRVEKIRFFVSFTVRVIEAVVVHCLRLRRISLLLALVLTVFLPTARHTGLTFCSICRSPAAYTNSRGYQATMHKQKVAILKAKYGKCDLI